MADYKRFCIAIIAILTLLILLQEAQAEIRVCPKDCSYSSIQEALNASLPNETVAVESGTYREDVFVGKPRHTARRGYRRRKTSLDLGKRPLDLSGLWGYIAGL
jgi:hypothetical protein